MIERKSQVHIERFSELDVEQLIEIFHSLDVVSKIGHARHIVIKPNLAAGTIKTPETGVVTNPEVLDLIIRSLIALNPGAQISIAESDSIGLGLAPAKFEFQKYAEKFGKYEQVSLVDLSRSLIGLFPSSGKFFKQGVVLPRLVCEADFFISLSKIKTHTNTVVTGVLKNQFGCLPDSDKDKYHPFLPNVIADVNSAIRPDLSIVEGCPAMQGRGPVNGDPLPLDTMLIGTDPVAVDATMARLMMFDPRKIPMITVAADVGLGKYAESEIELVGKDIKAIQRKFEFITLEYRFYIALGFAIQRLGQRINFIGHYVHFVEGTIWGMKKAFFKLLKMLSAKRNSVE